MSEYASAACRVVVGSILILAGWAKLRGEARHFLDAILAYDLVPSGVAGALSYGLPRAELALGAALVVSVLVPVSAAFAFVLVLAITGVVATALARGERHFCACFGFTDDQVKQVQWSIVVRNAALLAGLAYTAFIPDTLRLL